MISQLTIKNFQSHKNTELAFRSGVNCVIGPSDSGKSAILRALLWVATNRPSGESFRSNWGGDTRVEVRTSDRNSIVRIRGKGSNQYILDECILSGIGTDVPAEVVKVLNLSSVNIQHQLDAPFLLSETTGEVARQLNAIANLDIIDAATTNIAREVRRHTDDEKTHSLELFRITEEMKPYTDLPEQEELLAEIENNNEVLIQKKASQDRMQEFWTKIWEKEIILSEIGDVAGMEKLKDEVEHLNEALERKREIHDKVSDWIDDIDARERELEDLAGRAEAEKPFQELQLIITARDDACIRFQRCKRLNESIRSETLRVKVAKKETEENETEFRRLMPSRCPLCGQEVRK